ncbi:hypothetical protein [uncultured Thiothrix sp.]|jgi:heme/copper-type cytochrome/quinol oxidase subunit 2|uniref:hypothetical protein n=1 Tax=uncultured Thiothrix sp. TaxID=223185 RepID=UPI0026241DF2|nr:hypothetical protein [uncultured Thiothrix sp.]HMT93522.1 hypothetical protein [Thiolinea sp.]
MRTVYLLLTSLFLSSGVYAHTSLIPHIETESELVHALIHTSISIVLAASLYLIVRKMFSAKRVNFKRNRK